MAAPHPYGNRLDEGLEQQGTRYRFTITSSVTAKFRYELGAAPGCTAPMEKLIAIDRSFRDR